MEDFSAVPQKGPSMFLKGGIRCHPVRDGLIPLTREQAMRHRDQGGNLYTEITNPHTGNCQRVTSPLDTGGVAVIQPTPMVPLTSAKRDAGIFPQKRGKVWTQGVGDRMRTLRTVDMGDDRLPSCPPSGGSSTGKGHGSVKPNPHGGPSSASRNHPPRIPVMLVDAFILGVAQRAANTKARKARVKAPTLTLGDLKITPHMRKLARLEIARQQDIKAYCAK